jgi:predicted transcriptional regulator
VEKKSEKLQKIWEALAQARKEEYQSFRYNVDEGMLYALLKVEGQP